MVLEGPLHSEYTESNSPNRVEEGEDSTKENKREKNINGAGVNSGGVVAGGGWQFIGQQETVEYLRIIQEYDSHLSWEEILYDVAAYCEK
jgi:hypothetical protein